MTNPRTRQEGSMLIIALAVLVLLSLIAVTFAALMRLERRATENYTNLRKVQFVASSAESSVIAMLRGGLFWSGYNQWNEKTTPWLYGVESGKATYGGQKPLETATPRESSYAWHLGSSKPGGWDYFKTKVIDTNSQINLNGEQDTLADMLDALGEAIARDPDVPGSANPLRERYNAGTQYKGKDIVTLRLKQEGNRFTSKSQLRNLIGEKNYELIQDYVTTESWVDVTTQRSSDGIDRYSSLEDDSSTTVAGQPKILQTSIVGSARLSTEKRAPININLAPKPVLVACLQGLGCRRPFPWASIETQATEEANAGEIDDVLPPTQEELTLRSQPLWVYSTPLEYQHAERIAEAIILHRKATPFRVWQTGSRNSDLGLGFEEFVNSRITDSGGFFPPPTAIQVLNPNDNTKTTRYRGELLKASSPAGRMYAAGHKSAPARRQMGLSVSGRNAFYYDMMRAMLMANFNPNTRINKYNPNNTVYRAVDKSNLVKIDETGGGILPRPGHTVEFCFDSGGIFEITSVAQMTGAAPEEMSESDFKEIERFANTKRRSIVKIYDIIRHTSQKDFETPFQSGRFNSVTGRENITTYPDPIDAMHPDLFHGSNQDGRVEVIGYEDQKVSGNSVSWYQGNNKFPLHFGARYRLEQSKSRLRREYLKNRSSNEYQKEMNKVLNPSHTVAGGNLARRYAKLEWGVFEESEEGVQINEPNVDVVSRGGDLYPDGINSSIFRTSPLGTRFLRFPASRYRVSPTSQGAINHASDSGNVPYYKGGVAFWIKPEFNGSDPVFWGLVGCTQVQTEVGYDPESSEGTQFYVWKNTSGELRVSRLYYHQAFAKGETDQAIPLISEEDDESGQGGGDEVEFDERKTYARTDVYFDISDWHAHEWHHVAVAFDDEASEGNRVRIYIDFAEQDAGSVDMGQEKYCALNVEEPKDALYVCGLFRDQAAAKEGLFKFNTNYDAEAKREVAESVKRIPANATIDEFVTFDGGFTRAHGAIGYFTPKQARYTNVFKMPLPEGIQRLRIRSLSWTAYAPTVYHGAPVRFRPGQDLRMFVSGVDGQATLQQVPDASGDAFRNSQVAGRWVYARGNLPEDRVAELVYQVQMRAVPGSGGQFGARQVASPALDDVTLTYYLPSAQVLLTEEE